MSNLTNSVDEAPVRQARIRGIEEGASVRAKVRDFLTAYAAGARLLPAQGEPAAHAAACSRGLHGESLDDGMAPGRNQSIRAAEYADGALQTRRAGRRVT